ncbi:MAG: DUF3047 domain-containing protein [Rhodospirillaceae bacterium]
MARRASTLALGAALAGGIVLSVLAAEAVRRLPPALEADGWKEVTFEGKTPNTYAACGDGCIEIVTEASVSMSGRPADADLAATPVLSWEWRVTKPVTASDLTEKGKDDRAVAVYVTFPYDPDAASLSERLLRPMVELARGSDAPARVLSYVWGGFGAPGQVVESPFFGSVNAMIVARTQAAPVGEWLAERVDVAADHKRVFGTDPVKAAHVLIAADSDDTGADNRAFVRGLAFGAR